MIKFSFIATLLFIGFHVSYAQGALSVSGESQVLFYNENTNVEGSKFLFKDWKSATLVGVNGDAKEGVVINYDGMKGRFVSKIDDKNGIYLNTYEYKEVRCFCDDSGEENIYVNLASRGDASYGKLLFGNEKMEWFTKFTAMKTTSNKANYNEVTAMYRIKTQNKLLLYKDGELVEVSRKLKSLNKYFPDKNVKKIAKQNKLKLKSDKDFKSLMILLTE